MARERDRGGRAAAEEKIGEESIEITDEDAAFVLGKGGKTKMKIARVSECNVELDEKELRLHFSGTAKQRRHAKRYASCVMQQRSGTVSVSEADIAESCTVLPIPEEAIAFVTGTKGCFLRTLEDEHTVIMCFAEIKGEEKAEDDYENLLIFGARGARRSAQLQIMSVVEQKVPNYFLQAWRENKEMYELESDLVGDWGTTTMELEEDLLSYALGKKGATRKKIGAASGCIVQYLDNVVFMSGTKKQRQHAQDYLNILFKQLEDGMTGFDHKSRQDCTVVEIPHECVGYVTGAARETLNNLEEKFGVLMFFLDKRRGDKDMEEDDGRPKNLAILGPLRSRRAAELTVMSTVERKLEGYYSDSIKEKESKQSGLDTDYIRMDPDDVSYAVGAKGTTRMKIERAAGAIFQLTGSLATIFGDRGERQRCRDYLGWLLTQKDEGAMSVDVRDRDDVIEVELPDGRGDSELISCLDLRWLEQETGTFCFVAEDPGIGDQRLLIFGHEAGSAYSDTGRLKAERLARTMIERAERGETWTGSSSWRGGGGGGDDRYGRSDRAFRGDRKGDRKGGKGERKGERKGWGESRWEGRGRSRSPRRSDAYYGGKGDRKGDRKGGKASSSSWGASGSGGRSWDSRRDSWREERQERGGGRDAAPARRAVGSGPPRVPTLRGSSSSGAGAAASRRGPAPTPPWRAR